MEEILSKTALFIMGVIAPNPTNPYAISKMVNNKRNIFRDKIPTRSIYGTLNMLKKKGLVTAKRTSNGNMPDRIVYTLSNKGKELINKDLFSYLSNPESKLTELMLSIFLMPYIDRETVLKGLKEYREKTAEDIAIRKDLLAISKVKNVPPLRHIALEHTLKTLKVNLKTVKELIETVETNPEWNNDSAPWWREETLQAEKPVRKNKSSPGDK
jgi:DNA-binding PadR family transcriptional regulator